MATRCRNKPRAFPNFTGGLGLMARNWCLFDVVVQYERLKKRGEFLIALLPDTSHHVTGSRAAGAGRLFVWLAQFAKLRFTTLLSPPGDTG